MAALLAACASSSRPPAPVESRSGAPRPAAPPVAVSSSPAAETSPVTSPTPPLPPGSENAGKPGYYTVKPGDTMIRIGLETGQNWRDIQRWNELANPDVIEVGQVLRVVPPGTDPTQAAARPVVPPSKVESRPLEGGSGTAAVPADTPAPGSSVRPTATANAPGATAAPSESAKGGDEDVRWQWPAAGSVLQGFQEGRSKGLVIAGKVGDPVYAAADGRVVYAGSGLRGYGNLVIVKHNATYLTAYAHNRTLLVKDEQNVRRGQKIAEMGSTDAERVQLHFEIRRRGNPIDPTKLLPAR